MNTELERIDILTLKAVDGDISDGEKKELKRLLQVPNNQAIFEKYCKLETALTIIRDEALISQPPPKVGPQEIDRVLDKFNKAIDQSSSTSVKNKGDKIIRFPTALMGVFTAIAAVLTLVFFMQFSSTPLKRIEYAEFKEPALRGTTNQLPELDGVQTQRFLPSEETAFLAWQKEPISDGFDIKAWSDPDKGILTIQEKTTEGTVKEQVFHLPLDAAERFRFIQEKLEAYLK